MARGIAHVRKKKDYFPFSFSLSGFFPRSFFWSCFFSAIEFTSLLDPTSASGGEKVERYRPMWRRTGLADAERVCMALRAQRSPAGVALRPGRRHFMGWNLPPSKSPAERVRETSRDSPYA
jgi:hypothetical protein